VTEKEHDFENIPKLAKSVEGRRKGRGQRSEKEERRRGP